MNDDRRIYNSTHTTYTEYYKIFLQIQDKIEYAHHFNILTITLYRIKKNNLSIDHFSQRNTFSHNCLKKYMSAYLV